MKKLSLVLAVVIVAVMVLSACGTKKAELGTAENPIIMALAPSANTETLIAGGEAIAAKLTELTGYSIKTTVPTNYAALIEAMGSGNAQIGWLPPAAFIVAHAKGFADIAMITLRSGADHYAFQIVANAAGGYTSYYDVATGLSTADAKTALTQFAGKKPCWTDPLSASGYLVPAGVFGVNEIKVKAGAWVQGHPTVIKSVYLSPHGEICDFGATYVDARTNVVNDFPDVNDVVVIIWLSDATIPNDTVAYSTDLTDEMRTKLNDAFLQIAGSEEGLQLLKDGGYSIGGLKVVEDSFFDDFRAYLQSINFDFNNYR